MLKAYRWHVKASKYFRYLSVFEALSQISRAFASLCPDGFVCSQLEEFQHCLLSSILHCYSQSLTKKNTLVTYIRSKYKCYHDKNYALYITLCPLLQGLLQLNWRPPHENFDLTNISNTLCIHCVPGCWFQPHGTPGGWWLYCSCPWLPAWGRSFGTWEE